MTNKDFDERKSLTIVRDQLNEVGPGFCAAKWFMATIWLQDGRTSSCHHPPAHYIQDSDIENNPSGLHNTAHKKSQREQMIREERPDECSYCWQVEDLDTSNDNKNFSDRVIKSSVIPWHDTFRDVVNWETYPENVLTITSDAYKRNFNPRILEISFDNLCNLNCSYCNSDFSSTWAKDLKTNGEYTNLLTKNKGTWEKAVEFDFNPKSEENKYIKTFFEWFDSGLKNDLHELRVTGGEPMRSPSFWKLVDRCASDESISFKFAVNSNMMASSSQLTKLINTSKRFKEFELFTSCESYGAEAEFIRHGLDYKVWFGNVERFVLEGSHNKVTLMLTINALSLFSLTRFLDDVVAFKKRLNDKSLMRMSLNILRFPNFQSVTILPADIRMDISSKLSSWLESNREHIEDGEAINIDRLIDYLLVVGQTYEDDDTYEDRVNDFVEFYDQYGTRNGMNIRDSFSESPEFIKWWDTIYKTVRGIDE